MWLKKDNLRDALFMTLNSLSAVSWGNFDPSTPFQRALTVVFRKQAARHDGTTRRHATVADGMRVPMSAVVGVSVFAGVGFVGSIIGILASRYVRVGSLVTVPLFASV